MCVLTQSFVFSTSPSDRKTGRVGYRHPSLTSFFSHCFSLLVGLPFAILTSQHKSFKRGFFCNDDSIKYPYKEDTISYQLLGGVMIPITIVTVSANLFLTIAAYLFHVSLVFVFYVYCMMMLWVRLAGLNIRNRMLRCNHTLRDLLSGHLKGRCTRNGKIWIVYPLVDNKPV